MERTKAVVPNTKAAMAVIVVSIGAIQAAGS